MELAEVNGYALSSPIDPPQNRLFHNGTRRLLKRDVVLVVVETTDGQRGVATAGASCSAMREFFEDESQGTFADVISGPVADALEGQAIERILDARDLIRDTNLSSSDTMEAISAIDIALYDIRGRELGVPVYELLAEEYETDPTTDLDLYASAGMYMQPEGYVEQAKIVEDLGFFGYKYRPGIGVDGDRRTVELLADALTDCEIMLDGHTWWKLRDGYGPSTVQELVEHADEYGAYWVEEPVEPDNREAYIELAQTGASLAGGESENTPAGLVGLGKTGAVRYLQGDVRHHQGFSGCQGPVEFCASHDTVEFVPHNFGTWIGLAANAHLVAAAPGAKLIEYPLFENDPLFNADPDPGMYPFDLAFELIEGQPAIENGVISVTEDPGLGVELNLDVIDDYPFVDGPWTEFHYDD